MAVDSNQKKQEEIQEAQPESHQRSTVMKDQGGDRSVKQDKEKNGSSSNCKKRLLSVVFLRGAALQR